MRRAGRLAATSINAHGDRLKGCGTAAEAGELDVIRMTPADGGCYPTEKMRRHKSI